MNNDKIISLPPRNLMLGNLQPLFTSFYTSLFEYNLHKQLEYYPMKMDKLEERLKQYETQYINSLRQQKIIKEQLLIAEKQLKRDSSLNRKGVISSEELERTTNQYLQVSLSYENIRSSLENMQIQISQVKETLFDINFQNSDMENTLQTKIETSINQLQNEIQAWEMNYMLTSPIKGKITFTKYWVVNQNVVVGDMVFTIIPSMM